MGMHGEAHDEYKEIVKARILEHDSFIRATLGGARPGAASPWKRVVLRPVLIRDEKRTQVSYFDERRDISKNYRAADLPARLDELLALGFRNIHVDSSRATLEVTLGKGGKPRIRDSAVAASRGTASLEHDRPKQRLLAPDTSQRFLQAVGIMTAEGTVRADKRDKYRQIDEFLKLIQPAIAADADAAEEAGSPVSIVDCGCGNAYLTFAAYHYVAEVRKAAVHMTGIDVRSELLSKHEATAQSLGWSGLDFQQTPMIAFEPLTRPDIVLALHACDTATDEALAQAVRWRSRYIFSAPCCHHHLQSQLAGQETPAPFGPVYRHGILAERMGDILTDTLRALILRIMGYRTDVVEFVSSDHTARNLMIRAVHIGGAGAADPARFVRDYKELVAFWRVTPYLQELLGDPFRVLLE